MIDEKTTEEDLIIGSEDAATEPLAEAIDCEIYVPTEYELVLAACNALDTVESMDPLTDVGRKRKRRIMRKAMEILDFAVDNLHTLCFDQNEKDDSNQED